MDTIETLNPPAFTEYLKKYSNTICGRHPIGILIQVSFSRDSSFHQSQITLEMVLSHCGCLPS